VRELMAGLPREAPADVTSRVMRRVRHRATRRGARWVIAWGPVRAAGLVAIAAGLLMALGLHGILQFGRGRVGRGPDVLADRQSGEKPRRGVSETNWPSFSHPIREGTSRPLGSREPRPARVDPVGGEGSARGELMHVREYLDNPQLRRIFMVSNGEDGLGEQRVASVVEQTTRFNFYKITVSQGIVIDPRHPDQATVFALVVGPQELEDLRHRLRVALDDRVEETPVEPGVVTQLADIGHVEACPPSPAAELAIPRNYVAYQAGDEVGAGEVAEAPPPPRADQPKKPDRPTPEQERSSPRIAEEADPSFVVLVWVTRAHPG
jgi:hypothetical protein